MLPLKDFNPTRRFAVLTALLVAVNVAIFGYQLTKPTDGSLGSDQAFTCEYGMVPHYVVRGFDVREAPAVAHQYTCQGIAQRHPRFLSLLTSQFLHAGWVHLLGNMLFLWVFANNIEDRLGRLRFLPFYLLCGVIAAAAQALADPSSTEPLIGASGAISGVLGAYLLLYPRAMVLTLILPIFLLPLRAWIVLGLWFVLQFAYLGGQATSGGGVAYWAHIGGFLAGLLLIRPFLAGRPRPRDPTGGSTLLQSSTGR